MKELSVIQVLWFSLEKDIMLESILFLDVFFLNSEISSKIENEHIISQV